MKYKYELTDLLDTLSVMPQNLKILDLIEDDFVAKIDDNEIKKKAQKIIWEFRGYIKDELINNDHIGIWHFKQQKIYIVNLKKLLPPVQVA